MRKVITMLLCGLMMGAAFSGNAHGNAALQEEEETYMWSAPGKYLTDLMEPRAEIRNEQEAAAYAEELWSLIRKEPLPEGRREMAVDEHDHSYHFAIFNEEGHSLYDANFLSNGLVQQIGWNDLDFRRTTEGQVVRRDTLDDEVWQRAETQLIPQIETIAPGVTALVEPLRLDKVLDVGDRQYLILYAEPADPEMEAGLSIFAVIDEDGNCIPMEYSCYGAG